MPRRKVSPSEAIREVAEDRRCQANLLVDHRKPRFRTIQVCPKDFPAMPRQSEGAAPANFSREGVTMSERAIEERQGWAWDIIGVGIGLYSVLFLLVTFLCIYVPA